jgi:hypothetical protein
MMSRLGRTTPPLSATIIARRHPKVSKMGSPRRIDVVGENLVESQGLERHIWPTLVNHHYEPAALLPEALPPGRSHP